MEKQYSTPDSAGDIVPSRGNPHLYQDATLDLLNFFRLLWRRKTIVLILWFGVLLGAVLLTSLMPAVYQSRAVLEIGRPQTGLSLEEGLSLKTRLLDTYGIISGIELQGRERRIAAITAESNLPDVARDELAKITDHVLAEHRQSFTSFVAPRRERVAQLEERIQVINDALESLQAERENLVKRVRETERELAQIDQRVQASEGKLDIGNLTVTRALLLNTYGELGKELMLLSSEPLGHLAIISTLEEKVAAIESTITPLQAQPTRLLVGPTNPTKIKPKPVLYLSLAAIAGLPIAVFGALLVEFFKKAVPSDNG